MVSVIAEKPAFGIAVHHPSIDDHVLIVETRFAVLPIRIYIRAYVLSFVFCFRPLINQVP